ncbi:MAG: MFS transporter [Chloroflexi bacterium]|nr:MFS transporter [Chloroflexota bacterium]
MLSRLTLTFRSQLLYPTTREDRNVRRLILHTALFGVVIGGIISFLPVLLARLGASAVATSLLTALPALITIGFAIPAGTIVSRWTDPVRLSARCFYALRLSYPFIAIAALMDPNWAPWLIVIIWGLTAIPGTLGNTVFYDVLAESVPAQRRAAINGVRWALLFLVSGASVSLFGQMLTVLPWPANYLTLFAISFVVGICSIYMYSRLEMTPRSVKARLRERRTPRQHLADLLVPFTSGRGFGAYALVTLAMRIGYFMPAGLFSLFLVNTLKVSDAWIGNRTMIESVAMTVGYFFWGRVANRVGKRRMLVLLGIAVGLHFGLIAAATPGRLYLMYLAALLSGFFVTAGDVSLFEWLLEIMPEDDRPRYVAMNTLLLNVVAFGAPMLGAAIADAVGIPVVFAACGVSMLVCAALAFFLISHRPAAAGPFEDEAALMEDHP